jgi:hypothetical protein
MGKLILRREFFLLVNRLLRCFLFFLVERCILDLLNCFLDLTEDLRLYVLLDLLFPICYYKYYFHHKNNSQQYCNYYIVTIIMTDKQEETQGYLRDNLSLFSGSNKLLAFLPEEYDLLYRVKQTTDGAYAFSFELQRMATIGDSLMKYT